MASSSILLLVAVVAFAAGSAAASAAGLQQPGSSSQHVRRLLAPSAQTATQAASQCQWSSETNSCDAADAINIMYAVRGQPVSPYLWFLLMTHDRKTACDGYQTRDSCGGDAANNCVWLDDILAPATTASSSSSSSSSGRKPKAADAERAAAAAVQQASPNLFSSQVAALQAQYGPSLREMLGRVEAPILNPAMELMAGAGGAAAASSPAAASTSSSGKKGASSPPAAPAAGSKKQHALKCTSRELIENLVFTKSGYSSVLQAPLAMHCPGSKAHNLVRCMSQTTNAACTATPGCVVVPRAGGGGAGGAKKGGAAAAADLCVSQHFNQLSKQQMKQFMYDLTLAEPSVVGSCDGACWMRQALLCYHTVGADSCSQLSFCRAMGDSCVPKLYAQDHFGSTVQEYLGECMEVDNKKDCESYSLKLVNKGKYSTWSMPARAAQKCTVPSVGRMLGRATTAAKEGAARVEMLTMMGAETEKQAAALAAVTAAADAAKAARIMQERGATGLQQLYSSVSAVLG